MENGHWNLVVIADLERTGALERNNDNNNLMDPN